ncbi:MAG: hypothetical protein V8R01_01660 [Bacilli bacterium]
MAKAIKLQDDNYIDSSGVVHNRVPLNEILKPIVLYDNNTGEKSVVLSQEVTDFKRIDVISKQTSYNNTTYHTTTVYEPNDKNFTIQVINPVSANKGYYFVISAYQIRNKNITRIDNINYKMEIESSGHWYIADSLVIIKVIGYK